VSPSPPRLFIRRPARADVAAAFRWYEERSVGLGHEYPRAVRVALSAVQRAPEQYPIAVDDIRKARVQRFPYLVYFVVLPTRISVIAVAHGRQHPRHWQTRR
jgi:plasmid stabilization system protein ParE